MKICFIIHGLILGKLKLRNEIQSVFEPLKDKFELCFKQTERQGHATELAHECVLEQNNYIIAVGGDGTVNEVINGVMQSPDDVKKKIVIGVLPKGTGNDFARSLRVKSSVKELADLINGNSFKKTDIGKIEFADEEGNRKTKFFNNVADVGLGAETVKLLSLREKAMNGTFAYVKAVLLAFTRYKKKKLRVTTPYFTWEGKAISIVMANGKYFGSGLGITPQAQLNDGLIQLAIVGDVNKADFIRYLPRLKKADIIRHKKIHYERVEKCIIEAVDETCDIEIDGELIGKTPVETTLMTRELNILQKM